MSDQSKMQSYQQSSNYTRVPAPGVPTYTEAWALIEAARRMAASCDYGNKDDMADRKKIRDSIRLNWRLWTIFQAEMTTDEADQIPDQIRLNMLTLCKFVDEHTIETLRDPEPEKIRTLIEINRNIAAGLLESLQELTSEDGAKEQSSEEETVNIASIATSV